MGRRAGIDWLRSCGMALFATVCLALSALPSLAEVEVKIVHSATRHDAVFALHIQGERGVAVGDHGLLLLSTNYGKAWRALDSGTSSALLAIDILADGRGVAVGQNGIVLHTASGGERWSRVLGTGDARLFAVDLNSSGFGLAVGEFGALLQTDDGGRRFTTLQPTWSAFVDTGDIPHLYDVLVMEDGRLLVAGEFGMILASNNRGATWSVVARAAASVFRLREMPGGQLWAVGQNGMISRSLDRGRTWKRHDLVERGNLLDIYVGEQGHGVLLAWSNMRFSYDAGETWSAEAVSLPAPWCLGVTPVDKGAYLLACAAGTILHVRMSANAFMTGTRPHSRASD